MFKPSKSPLGVFKHGIIRRSRRYTLHQMQEQAQVKRNVKRSQRDRQQLNKKEKAELLRQRQAIAEEKCSLVEKAIHAKSEQERQEYIRQWNELKQI